MSANWFQDYLYRKSHEIANATGSGTGYQVKIRVINGSGSDSGNTVYIDNKSKADFGDIRFTDNDGDTLLDYWIVEKTDGDEASFWVEVADDLSSSNATIYMYYGNSTATTLSNGTVTFPELFTDFPGSDLPDGWEESDSGGSYTVSGSVLNITGPATETIRTTGIFNSSRALGMGHLYVDISSPGATNVYEHAGLWNFPNVDVMLVQQYHTEGDRYGTYSNAYETTDFDEFEVDHDYEIRWPNSSVCFYAQDDVVGATHSNQVTGTSKQVTFRVAGSFATSSRWIVVDWVYYRKYVDPEPVHGGWGAEEGLGYEITFRFFEAGGQFRVNCTNTANGTTTSYANATYLELIAVCLNESWLFINYTSTNGNSTSNPYTYQVVSNDTISLYFRDPPLGKGVTANYQLLFVGACVFVGLVVVIPYLVVRRRRKT